MRLEEEERGEEEEREGERKEKREGRRQERMVRWCVCNNSDSTFLHASTAMSRILLM